MSTDLKTIIGPENAGQTMTLEDFEHAEFDDRYHYELSRGVVAVNDVPKPRHLEVLRAVRRQLNAFELGHPDLVSHVAGGGECRLLIEELQSERHPDLAVYLTEAPDHENDVWSRWVPELLVEVVSPSSRARDYDEKPDEYLRFGVKEYWIVDPDERHVVVLERYRGRWQRTVITPPTKHASLVLPGFELLTESLFGPVPEH